MMEISRITTSLPGITSAIGQQLAEACVVCLMRQHHLPGSRLSVSGAVTAEEPVFWEASHYAPEAQLNRAYADQQEATELGAVCIAILLVLHHTPYTVISRSEKGTGVDYWLGHDPDDSLNLFEHKARLEISGIFEAEASVFRQRISQKTRQVAQSHRTGLPAYVAIVEFGQLQASFTVIHPTV